MIGSLSADGPRDRRRRRRRGRLHRRRAVDRLSTPPTSTGATSRFREKLEARVGTTVVVDNDANAAGWAEFRFGAGRLVSDMVMLTIGTGVGGAIVAGDRLFRGGFGAGGRARPPPRRAGRHRVRLRPARMPRAVRLGSRPAAHGERDRRRRRDRPGARARPRRSTAPSTAASSAPSSSRRTRARSPHCASSATGSARPSASLSAVLDPQRFVFGGGVAVAGELLLGPIREAYLEHLPARGYHPEPDFVIAELVNDAGVVGAADLARVWVAEHA